MLGAQSWVQHSSGVSQEGQNHLSWPAGYAAFDAAQDMVGLLGSEHQLTSNFASTSTCSAGLLSIPSSLGLCWLKSFPLSDLFASSIKCEWLLTDSSRE